MADAEKLRRIRNWDQLEEESLQSSDKFNSDFMMSGVFQTLEAVLFHFSGRELLFIDLGYGLTIACY